jgi:chromosome segregation ATPase
MPENPDSSLIDKLKIRAFPILLGGLNILLTRQINEAASEIKETRKDIIELSTTVKIETLECQYLTQRVTNLEAAKAEAATTHKEFAQRINSLEQRAAMHDQFMSSYFMSSHK